MGYTTAQAKAILDVTSATSGQFANGTETGMDQLSNSTFFVTYTAIQPTGTGVIDPFLTIQFQNQQSGYNSDTLPLDTKRPQFTDPVTLGKIGTTDIGGVTYLQFLLDVDQVANGPISLNQVQFFTSNADVGDASYTLLGAEDGTGPTQIGGKDARISFTNATEVFRLNNQQNTAGSLATNYEIQVDSGHGNGSGDMFLYVQKSLFGTDDNAYVTLFSQFGTPSGTFDSNASFEEWAFREGSPDTNPHVDSPEPATLAMALTGLLPLAIAGVRQRRRRLSA